MKRETRTPSRSSLVVALIWRDGRLQRVRDGSGTADRARGDVTARQRTLTERYIKDTVSRSTAGRPIPRPRRDPARPPPHYSTAVRSSPRRAVWTSRSYPGRDRRSRTQKLEHGADPCHKLLATGAALQKAGNPARRLRPTAADSGIKGAELSSVTGRRGG